MNEGANFWFPTKEDVCELYIESNYEDGFVCVCSATKYENGLGNRISCLDCGRTISLTAGTFFHGYRVPVEKLALIQFHFWLNPNVAAFSLARELEMPFTTVWRILHKLRRKVKELFPSSNYEQIDCGQFAAICFRRSDELPAKARAEQVNTDEEQCSSLPDQLPAALRHLTWSAHIRLRTGFQGVSRKHLQPYLLSVFFAPAVKTKEEFLKFFRGVLRSSPITDVEIEQYSSPELLLLPSPS